jgi:gliding motility-associated-like protein
MRLDIQVDSCNLFIPNVFSPNGDGKNDYFDIIANGYTGYHLVIFDRWGLKMFESFENTNLWNGLINNTGGKAPDGTYYYIFFGIDYSGDQYSTHGFLTLIR